MADKRQGSYRRGVWQTKDKGVIDVCLTSERGLRHRLYSHRLFRRLHGLLMLSTDHDLSLSLNRF